MRYLFLFWLLAVRSTANDLYEGLFDPISARAQFAATRTSIPLTSPTDEVVWEQTEEGVEQATRESLHKVREKMSIMDRASSLPPELAARFRKEQKRLRSIQTQLARKAVQEQSQRLRPSNRRVVDSGDLQVEEDTGVQSNLNRYQSSPARLSQAAALALKKIEDPRRRREFQRHWEVSYADNRARNSFGAYVASLGLHGTQGPGVEALRARLKQYARESMNLRRKDPKAVMTQPEVGDFLARSLKGRQAGLPFPVARTLQRIESLERQARNASNMQELKSLSRAVELEKKTLVKTLEREGLKIDARAVLTPGEVQVRMLEWLQKRNPSSRLQWPFEGQAVILQHFSEQQPHTVLQTRNLHGLLSPCEGSLSLQDEQFSVACHQVLLVFAGDIDLIVESGTQLQPGDRIGFLKEPYEISVSAQKTGLVTSQASDFLSFY